MKNTPRIERGRYTEMEYTQHSGSRVLAAARWLAGALTWPATVPLGLLSRRSDVLFRTISELFSLVPYAFGIIIRAEFYRFALARCGRNIVIEFGTVFIYSDISIGDNVTIGRYNVFHHCDIGSFVLAGESSCFLSGSKQHNYARIDVPMALQGGKKKRIVLEDGCWVGAHSVVMDDVGTGAIVGAGSVVTRPVAPYAIVAGNPAQQVRSRQPSVTEVGAPDSRRWRSVEAS